MGVNAHAHPAPQTATFRWSGKGLAAAERAMWREQVATVILAHYLGEQPRFWDQVERVHRASSRIEAATTIAGLYARGNRRRAMMAVLAWTAIEETDALRRLRLVNVGSSACTVPDDPPGRASTYTIGPSYFARIESGAIYAARRGASRCLACGEAIANGAALCRLHDGRPELERGILRELRRTFDTAMPAIQRGPGWRYLLELEGDRGMPIGSLTG